MKMEVGDWVQGKTISGEFIFGYVEQCDWLEGIVHVNVVKSDNDESVGRIALANAHRMKKQPEQATTDEGSIRSLIDIALSIQDEAWFMELSGVLKEMAVNGFESKGGSRPHASRLSTYI
ncbi:hypothetical protein [Paenibacillus sp. NPDC058071]|uniref:hypothetical protein n=1 Tax=Paenibacillus sp. NPDC058071 TaxID=3346326 RepID=UPI0036D8A9E2